MGTSGDFTQRIATQNVSIIFSPGTKPGSIPAGIIIGATVINNLSELSQPTFWLAEHDPNILLYEGDTNSDVDSHKDTDLIGIFGSALWAVDYMIFGMTLQYLAYEHLNGDRI